MISDNTIIPAGRLASDDDELQRKREELRRRLLNGEKISISSNNDNTRNCVYDSLDLEKVRYTGNIYGEYDSFGNYRIISTYDEKGINSEKFIGKIFSEEPKMLFFARETHELQDRLFNVEKEIRRLKGEPEPFSVPMGKILYDCYSFCTPYEFAFSRLLGFGGLPHYMNFNKVIGFYHGHLLRFMISDGTYCTIKTFESK